MITLFKQYNQNVTIKSYYRLYTDKSYEKLKVALDKLDILDEFYADWSIDDDEYNWDDIVPEIQNIITNIDILYLVVTSLRRFGLFNEETFLKERFNNYKYCGEVKVTDEDLKMWEIKKTGNKYNL